MDEQQRSAGILVHHGTEENREWLLLLYPADHWGFPKGHLENNESEWEAAVRELEEETGLANPERDENFRETIEYQFRQDDRLISKSVVFFSARVSSQAVRLSEEHEDYRWLPDQKAVDQITYENERRILQKWLGKTEI